MGSGVILCDGEIRLAIAHGQIDLSPVPQDDAYTTSAVDLTLGEEFRRWVRPRGKGVELIIDIGHPETDYVELAEHYQENVPVARDGTITVHPGDPLLGLTRERIGLPAESRIAARVEGRSRLARFGVGVHVTAPTVHAGFRGRITLEVTNQGLFAVKLRPGMRVCQLIFERLGDTPSSEMAGIFQEQESSTGKRPEPAS